MNKNQIILITLISLIESGSLSDTVFTYNDKNNETLFMTLINELEIGTKAFDDLMESMMEGDQEEQLEFMKKLLERIAQNEK